MSYFEEHSTFWIRCESKRSDFNTIYVNYAKRSVSDTKFCEILKNKKIMICYFTIIIIC